MIGTSTMALGKRYLVIQPRAEICWYGIGSDKHFSVKSQILNIFRFVGHTVSVTTTQHFCCSRKATGNNMKKGDCVSVKLYLQKQAVGRVCLWVIVCQPLCMYCKSANFNLKNAWKQSVVCQLGGFWAANNMKTYLLFLKTG